MIPASIEDLAQSLERMDVKLVAPPQLRVAYLTAWPTSDGTVAFRGDVYGLDGTGFVVGQPLPVGEKSATGERFVLKPVPRQLAADRRSRSRRIFLVWQAVEKG